MTDDAGIECFDHATIVVRDVDAATEAYTALLGFPPTWRGEHPELGTRAALFGLSNAIIELVGPADDDDDRAAGLRALLDAQGDGLQAIAFGTADADACRGVLRERGVRAAPPEAGEARGQDGQVRSYRSMELSPRSTRGLGVLVVERDDLADLQTTHAPLSSAVEALDHVVIRTADPEAALALYRDGLGIRLALDRDFRGTRMLFFRVGGVTVEVVQGGGETTERDGFGGLALRVGDIDAAHGRLADAGLEVSGIRDGNKPGTRVFTVREGTCGVPTLIIRDPARDHR